MQKKRKKIYISQIKYKTQNGLIINSSLEQFLDSELASRYKGKVQLIFTSPPFPLNTKKGYGNYTGEEYILWLSDFAKPFRYLLKPKGSIVMELGNSWIPGIPVMSTLSLESLLSFKARGNYYLCQQFILHNPARLPSPAQWVNIERIRVKDSFTHIWWMSKSPRPKANNRNILKEYSKSMIKLLKDQNYNSGKRPSEHKIGKTSFLKNNIGAIPSNVFSIANTKTDEDYSKYCKRYKYQMHPARMPFELAEFFIKFLSSKHDIIFDPFAGSNTTGFAAEKLERQWLSIEANNEYIKGSRGRFKGKLIR